MSTDMVMDRDVAEDIFIDDDEIITLVEFEEQDYLLLVGCGVVVLWVVALSYIFWIYYDQISQM